MIPSPTFELAQKFMNFRLSRDTRIDTVLRSCKHILQFLLKFTFVQQKLRLQKLRNFRKYKTMTETCIHSQV